MKVLVIRFARFGDIVLLLPALAYLKKMLPGCHLTVLTDARWHSLVAMSPAVDAVIAADRLGMRDGRLGSSIRTLGRLVWDIRRARFDAVIDCHSFRETNLLARWTGAARRVGMKRFGQPYLGFCFNLPPVPEDKGIHVSEMFFRVMDSLVAGAVQDRPTAPALVIPPEDRAWAQDHFPAAPFVALYVDAPVKERRWPLDRFAALAKYLREKLGVDVVVLSERPVAEKFLPGVRILSDLSIPRLAAVIGAAKMFVSNDTGPMHLGPALGVPTVALFSVGIPLHFRPTGANDCYLQALPIEVLQLDAVIDAVNRVWTSIAG